MSSNNFIQKNLVVAEMQKLIEKLVHKTLQEDIYSVLNYGEAPPTELQSSTYARLIANKVNNLYDRLGVRLELVQEIKQTVETKTKEKISFDQSYLDSFNLVSLSKAALTEYQEFARKQTAVAFQQESLTFPTVASFSLGAAQNLDKKLELFKPIAINFKAVQLEHAINLACSVLKTVNNKAVSWIPTDVVSLSIYKTLWDHGFQSSKTFLGDQDYLGNKDNARTKCESLFYKMVLVANIYPAIRILLSVLSGYLLQAELNPQSADWLKAIHDHFVNG